MKRYIGSLIALILLSFLVVPIGFAQSSDELKALKSELEEIRKGQSAIQKELEAIKSLLQPRQPPSPVQPANALFSIDSDPIMGNKNARLVLIEFTDYQCPFCARHLTQTMPQIDKEYIQTGKIQYVLRDFPIESLHPLAFEGHAAAHCAGEQGKYWEMHSKLFANQKAMGPKDFSDHAHALRLDVAKFDRCLDSKKYSAKVRASIADGQKAGVQGTPTFFLGFPETDVTKIKAVQLIRGAQPYPLFKTAIDSLLGEQK